MLTDTERDAVLAAAVLVDSQEERYSCHALRSSGASLSTISAYEEMYGEGDPGERTIWQNQFAPNGGKTSTTRHRNQRVMMLLTFAEIG